MSCKKKKKKKKRDLSLNSEDGEQTNLDELINILHELTSALLKTIFLANL